MEQQHFHKAQSKRNEIINCENIIKELKVGNYLDALGRIYAFIDSEVIDLLIKYHTEKLETLEKEFKEI